MTQGTASRFLQSPWASMTLGGLALGAASLRPDSVVLADALNKPSLCGRPARQIGAGALNAEARHLALKLGSLGLKPGEAVLVLLPNTVEAGIGILGVIAGGGVPAVMAVFESAETIAAAARLVDAVGILTMERFAGIALAETARNAAAMAESVRFVASFGEHAPSGVAALDNWETVEFLNPVLPAYLAGADTATLITFDRIDGAMRALVRSNEQLIAEAAMMAAEAQIATGSRLLVTIPAATTAGVIAGLVLPLLAGAKAELDALFDDCCFAARLGRGKGLTIVLPASAEQAFHAHCKERSVKSETLILVHRPRAGERIDMAGLTRVASRTIDCFWLGESCGVLRRRGRTPTGANTPGRIQGLFMGDTEPLRQLRQERRLAIAGPMAPKPFGSMETAPLETGFPFEITTDFSEPASNAEVDAATAA